MSVPLKEFGGEEIDRDVDVFLQKFYKDSYQRPDWLEEHLDCELPSIIEVEEELTASGHPFLYFQHGDPAISSLLVKIELVLSKLPVAVNREFFKMNRFYNCELFENDFPARGIRTFVVARKDQGKIELQVANQEDSAKIADKYCRIEGFGKAVEKIYGVPKLVKTYRKQSIFDWNFWRYYFRLKGK